MKSLLKRLIIEVWGEVREVNKGWFSMRGGASNSREPILPIDLFPGQKERASRVAVMDR